MSGKSSEVPKRIPDPWDFEIENDFRGPSKLSGHAEARQFVEKIARNYRDARAREEAASRLTQVLRKFRDIDRRADILTRAVSNLTVDEYRLIHIGAEKEHDPASADLYQDYVALRDLLFPRDWENAFSKRRSSGLSDHTARISSYFSQLSPALAAKHGFQLSHPDPGGKTKSVHLLVPSAKWRLVHMSWQTFASMPNLRPSGAAESPFHTFLKLIHQAVTGRSGSFGRELTGEHGHYARRRRAFDTLVMLLRQKGATYGWSNFQEMEDVLVAMSRRPTNPLGADLRASLLLLLDQYIGQRTLLLLGPRASAQDANTDPA